MNLEVVACSLYGSRSSAEKNYRPNFDDSSGPFLGEHIPGHCQMSDGSNHIFADTEARDGRGVDGRATGRRTLRILVSAPVCLV
jgi:hypothetical protein